MCVVSMVMEHKTLEWERRYPPASVPQPYPPPYPVVVPQPYPLPYPVPLPAASPTQQEIDEFRRLLERAREYDRKNHEPDCELQEKRDKLKKLAAELGIEIDFV